MGHPITRTPWIDDDGTGTTGTIINNAEKQALYNQIDAAIVPLYGTFTPADLTGSGIVFTGGTKGMWSKYGRVVDIWMQMVFPTTSVGTVCKMGTFPYISRAPVGVAQGYGTARIWWQPEGSGEVDAMDAATGQPLTWAAMSGSNVILSLRYLTD